jgi:hypothetical protein
MNRRKKLNITDPNGIRQPLWQYLFGSGSSGLGSMRVARSLVAIAEQPVSSGHAQCERNDGIVEVFQPGKRHFVMAQYVTEIPDTYRRLL